MVESRASCRPVVITRRSRYILYLFPFVLRLSLRSLFPPLALSPSTLLLLLPSSVFLSRALIRIQIYSNAQHTRALCSTEMHSCEEGSAARRFAEHDIRSTSLLFFFFFVTPYLFFAIIRRIAGAHIFREVTARLRRESRSCSLGVSAGARRRRRRGCERWVFKFLFRHAFVVLAEMELL